MSTNEELWARLAERVARSHVGGVGAEDDDVLAAADIIEAAINPHRGAQAGGMGAMAPGMMPPMMMGGMGGQSGGGGGTGSARVAEPTAPAPGPNPGPAAMGVPGQATKLRSEPGPAGSVGGGRAVGGGGALAESELQGAGAPGAGPCEPEAAPEAEPTVEPEQGSAVSSTETQHAPPSPPGKDSQFAPETLQEGFIADPAHLHALAERWTDLAERLGALPRHTEAPMGLFERAQRPHQALVQQLNAWQQGAVAEFEATATRLHETAAQYQAVDDDGVAELTRTEGMDS